MRIVTVVLSATIALGVAGCGDEKSTAAPGSRADLERIANKWAPLYAAAPNPGACRGFDPEHPNREVASKYMYQPACEHAVCSHAGGRPIENCTPPSPGFQKSFADATVQEIAIEGERAAVMFSNGEVVRFFGGPPDKYSFGGPPWWGVQTVGDDAGRGFFD